MIFLRWAFITLNVIYCVLVLWGHCMKFNAYGRREITIPSAWVNIWQLIGVGIVIAYGYSALNLIGWYIIGWIICTLIAKVMIWMGHDPLAL